MTTEQALKILNNNNSGRIYTREEAAALKDFYGKLGIVLDRVASEHPKPMRLKVV